MGATKTLLTFEEFERLPDQPGKRELLRGELIELPPGEFKHNEVSHRIFLRLHAALEADHACGRAAELGRAYHEMGYKLSNRSYGQPDVSITHAGQAVSKYLGGAPAIAIEVISPSNTARQMELKTKLYFEYGAREVWTIYPEDRFVLLRFPGSLHEVAENQSLTTPLLAGLSISVREILGE